MPTERPTRSSANSNGFGGERTSTWRLHRGRRGPHPSKVAARPQSLSAGEFLIISDEAIRRSIAWCGGPFFRGEGRQLRRRDGFIPY